MKLIQTLYFDKEINPYLNTFGWSSSEYHLMSWALSCLQIKTIYNNVELYTNSSAAKLLIDDLQLPYTKVYTTHDNFNLIHPQLWALPKLYTYSLQETPFLHIDGDVFIFSPFSNELLSGDLIVQSFEKATEYYTLTQKELQKYFTYFPFCVEKDFNTGIPITAVNAGIIGGQNFSFFKNYTSLAFDYIIKNNEKLKFINIDRFNVLFEQHLFFALAKEKNISIRALFIDYVKENEYKYLGNFHEVPCRRNYLHLLGHFKKDEFTCIKMAEKLRELYPDYYYRIVSLFKKNKLPFFISLYNNVDINIQVNTLNTKATIAYQKNESINPSSDDLLKIKSEKYALLEIAEKVYNDYLCENCDEETNVKVTNDFLSFCNNILNFLEDCKKISPLYLYGRDIASVNWTCQIFGKKENKNYLEKQIVRCNELFIIESKFDWAGAINKFKRVGVQYYQKLQIELGEFYNLTIPEITKDNFSIYDIDEFEVRVLEKLSTPCTINQVLESMKSLVNEDVIINHYEVYETYITNLIEDLVIKKAIKPI